VESVSDPIGDRRPSSTSFVGRRAELERLGELLTSSRVLTILGPGGSGKTRLAEELLRRRARTLAPDVAFAYLAPAGDPAALGEIVAAAVGLRSRDDPIADLVAHLGARRTVLVLDNCEHVRPAAAELAARVVDACPGVTVVATSRSPLLVPGEQLFPVGGLAESPSVALFVDRVRLSAPSFVLDDADRPVVVRICERLDGMPLAIELAAARLSRLGLSDLERRLAGHLPDLGSVASVAPRRQRTLRDAIDWSHDLLDDRQRCLWRRLSGFAGGFTLAAAEEVSSFAPLDRDEVEPLLGDLVGASMVAFDLEHGRYRLVEAMREYGLEQLRRAGEDAAVAARFRAWMLDRAAELDRRWWGPDQAELLDGMAADAANLRAALESCRAAGAGETGLRIAVNSLWYWLTRASHAEAARWFVPFLEDAADPRLAARAYIAAAWIAVLSARLPDARRFLVHGHHFAQALGDPAIDAYRRVVAGLILISEGRLDEAVGPARELLADPAADPMCRSWALVQLALSAFLDGDWEEGARISQLGIDHARSAGETWTRVIHLHLQAVAVWQRGDPTAATAVLLEALRLDRRLDDIWHRAWTVECLAWVTVDLGRPDRAACLLGIAAACWDAAGSSLTTPWLTHHETALARLREALGPSRLASEMDAGRALDPARALSYALDDVKPETVARIDEQVVSPREHEVAALVAAGLPNRAIGERLFVSPRTVETHVQHLMNKLGVGSRSEIAAWHARSQAAGEGAAGQPASQRTIR
jgi:non-specific serine/threonine protein kinase